MKVGKSMAYIIGVGTFIGVMALIGIVVHTIWPDYWFSNDPLGRIIALFISFVIASMINSLIRGEEPEPEVNEDQKITRDEVSKRLEEMRNSNKPGVGNDKINQEPAKLNDKPELIENPQKTDLDTINSKTHSQEIEKGINPKAMKTESKVLDSNNVISEPFIEPEVVDSNEVINGSSIGSNFELNKENSGTVRNEPQNSNLSQNSCPDCGGSNVAQAKYCAFCGSKLDLEYASIIGRFFALLIDWIILAIASFSIFIGTSIIYDGNVDLIFSIWVILTIFIGFLYFMVFEGPFMQGQTIGKMAVSIRVVDEKSRGTISYTQSFIRNLLLIIDLMPYFLPYLLGLISALASKKNQRIGDMGAKTIVIQKKHPKN